MNVQDGLCTLDFEKLRKTSDKEFRKIHLEEINSFIRNHVKQTGRKPICGYCKEIVERSEDLVRERGGSSHIWCFEPIYNSELRKKFPGHEQEYFDRLIKVFC